MVYDENTANDHLNDQISNEVTSMTRNELIEYIYSNANRETIVDLCVPWVMERVYLKDLRNLVFKIMIDNLPDRSIEREI